MKTYTRDAVNDPAQSTIIETKMDAKVGASAVLGRRGRRRMFRAVNPFAFALKEGINGTQKHLRKGRIINENYARRTV